MEMIAKISKGSNMDQIYIPKNREAGFSSGQYVLIMPLEGKLREKHEFKPFFYGFYGAGKLESLKLKIISEIFDMAEKVNPQNIIITGSFLEPGFRFNDIDILIIKEEGDKDCAARLKSGIEDALGIKIHIILLNSKTLMSGLATDPLYSLMLSKCVSKNRIIFNVKRDINYKILDLQLLKSEELIDKYYLILNMFSITFFIQNKKLSKEIINKAIERAFGITIKEIRENLIEKDKFVKTYKEIYNKTFEMIMERI